MIEDRIKGMETSYPELYNNFFDKVKEYITKPINLEKIREAFLLAEKCHENQKRKEGVPYITHPVAVATILTELKVGPECLAAGLLHDTVEDTDMTLKELEERFGESVAKMVDGVTKLSKLENIRYKDEKVGYHQKMLLAMAEDMRVVLIKIADRLHNLRTMDFMPREKQIIKAKETLDIYAPLAHRLGLFRIKAELEDRALKYVDPDVYYYVSGLLQSKKSERETKIDNIIENISKLLKENNLNFFYIKGRIKNIYSIYKKLVINKRDFEDIYDLLAIRIIVDKVEDCYQALGIIHANYTPIPKRFKDYIAMPKPNLYQSLHTTVLTEGGTLFEVQIRTTEMDKIAEFGVAAHWAYKESKVYSKEQEQFELAKKLKWYADILKITSDKDENEDLVETIKSDILKANVYVFTPNSEVIELPVGSTPIDFAYMIHTEVGNHMVGATINNKIAPINTELKTGDIVSIKTNKNSFPSEDWLKMAKSSHAKAKIKAYLNKANRDLLISRGKEELLREAARINITDLPDDNFVSKNFSKQNLNNIEDLLVELGKGTISVKTVIAKMEGKEIDKDEFLKKQMEKTTRILTTSSDTGIFIEGLTNPQIKLAQCCNPVYGDEIIGYVSKNQGIVCHTKFCKNVNILVDNRLINVEWASNVTRKYGTWIFISSAVKNNILQDVVTKINSASISIAELKSTTDNNLQNTIKVKVLLKNVSELNVLILNLKKIEGVFQVERAVK